MPRGGIWLAWLVALAALPATMPNAYVQYVVNLSLILAFATIGLNVIFGYAGQHAFGFPVFFGVGAYASALLAIDAGWPVAFSIPVAAVAAGAVSAIIGFPSFRLRGIYFGVATIAFAYVIYIIAQNWVDFTRGPMGIPLIPELRILPAGGSIDLGRDTQVRIAAVVLLGAVLWVVARLMDSAIGRAWIAIRENENLAASLGISPLRYQMAAFVFGAAISGLGGGLYAHYVGFVSPVELGFHYVIIIFIMLIAGGVGTLAGPLVGAVVFGVLPEILRVAEMARSLLLGVILLLCMAVVPEGVTGLWSRLKTLRAAPGSKTRPTPARTRAESEARQPGMPEAPLVPPTTPPGALEVHRVSKRFQGLDALSDVSFKVVAGEVVGLIGPNGAGKTTLFNIITGFLKPTSGTVRYRAEQISARAPHDIARLGITRTYQITSVFPDLTVAENVRTATHLRASRSPLATLIRTPGFVESETSVRSAVDAYLDVVGLSSNAEVRASALSYGDQRRLEVAIALATGARLLLLDEPAAGLNAEETDELCELIRRLRHGGFTVIVIEHDMRMVMSVCDRIIVLNHGQMIFDGAPDEAAADQAVIDAYLGTVTDDA